MAKRKRTRARTGRSKPRRTGKRSALRVVEGGDRLKNGKITERDGKGRFVKGGSPGPGRRRGSRNRVTIAAKQAIHEALNAGDGAVAYLIRMRDSRVGSDRSAFMHLVGRLVPREVMLEGDVDVKTGEQVVVFLPDNLRGPLPHESKEAFERRREATLRQREAEEGLRRRREHGGDE